jgi:UDP-N-acetylenolpyruvoylglucosamine reductase
MDNSYYNGLTGEIITPLDEQYEEDRQVYNRSIQKFPDVIVYCSNKSDVINAISWAQEKSMQIRIRTGGHNYEGYSVGNKVIVIDISRMNKLKLDKKRNVLKIEGGVVNSQIYELLGNEGYPFPSGTCPTVGAAGLTLGGGWGLSCRYFGLTCDSLLSLEIIDYTGNIITANENHNSDLFWACRGAGGGNFGVVVSMTFRLPSKVAKVSLIEFYCLNATQEKMNEFMDIWQNWLIDLDGRITLVSRLHNTEEEGKEIYGRGIFYGLPEEANEILKPFRYLEGMEIYIEYLTFTQAIEDIEDSYPDFEKFKSTGRFVYKNYNSDEINNITDIVQSRPDGSIISGVSLYALGGKVKDVNKDETAFYYRNAKYIMLIQSVWEDSRYAEDNINWVKHNFKYIKSITKGSYVNFPYNDLKCYDNEYYGKNVCRLKEINKKYDPYNVFKFPQSIN